MSNILKKGISLIISVVILIFLSLILLVMVASYLQKPQENLMKSQGELNKEIGEIETSLNNIYLFSEGSSLTSTIKKDLDANNIKYQEIGTQDFDSINPGSIVIYITQDPVYIIEALSSVGSKVYFINNIPNNEIAVKKSVYQTDDGKYVTSYTSKDEFNSFLSKIPFLSFQDNLYKQSFMIITNLWNAPMESTYKVCSLNDESVIEYDDGKTTLNKGECISITSKKIYSKDPFILIKDYGDGNYLIINVVNIKDVDIEIPSSSGEYYLCSLEDDAEILSSSIKYELNKGDCINVNPSSLITIQKGRKLYLIKDNIFYPTTEDFSISNILSSITSKVYLDFYNPDFEPKNVQIVSEGNYNSLNINKNSKSSVSLVLDKNYDVYIQKPIYAVISSSSDFKKYSYVEVSKLLSYYDSINIQRLIDRGVKIVIIGPSQIPYSFLQKYIDNYIYLPPNLNTLSCKTSNVVVNGGVLVPVFSSVNTDSVCSSDNKIVVPIVNIKNSKIVYIPYDIYNINLLLEAIQ